MRVLIIHENDIDDGRHSVIGVASSIEKAETMIEEFYGPDYVQLNYNDIRDSGLEYSKILNVKDHNGILYPVQITLEWFDIDKI